MDPDAERIQRTSSKVLQSISDESQEVLEKALSKLAEWLKYPRVYSDPYLRKQVLCLLLAADLRIRKEVGFSQNSSVPFNVAPYLSPDYPFVEAYAKLLEAIQPFQSQLKDTSKQPAVASIFDSNHGLRPGLSTSNEAANAGNTTMISTVSGLNNVKIQTEPSSEGGMATFLQVPAPKLVEEVSESIPEKYSSDSLFADKAAPISNDSQQDSTAPIMVSGSSMPNILTQRRKTKKKVSINFLARFDEEDQLRKQSTSTQESLVSSSSKSLPSSGIVAVQRDSTSIQDQAGTTIPDPDVRDTNVHRDLSVAMSTGQKPPEAFNRLETTVNEMTTIKPSIGLNFQNDSMTTGVMQMRLTDPTCSPAAVREEGTLKSGESSPLLHLMKSSNFIPAESKMSHSTAAQVSQQASLDLWELPPYNEAESLFGPDLRILSVKTGRKEHAYISFELHLSEADFSGLKYWKESKSANSLKDIQTSFCISIACYRREDLLDDLNLLSSRVSVLSSSWPQHPASSSLLIKTLTSELSVPLSPPIYLTPDKLVDISPWLHLGGNQFGILQQGMDDYAFVILLHRPTRKQLQQVSAARLNDLAWQHFLDGFSAPIEYIPLRSLTLTANPEK